MENKAQDYARDTRLKFERVYESARKAIAAGDTEMALLKCHAALDLLNTRDLYGPQQMALGLALEDRIRRLSQTRGA